MATTPAADANNRNFDFLSEFSGEIAEITFIDAGFYAADGSTIAADFDWINSGVCEHFTNK